MAIYREVPGLLMMSFECYLNNICGSPIHIVSYKGHALDRAIGVDEPEHVPAAQGTLDMPIPNDYPFMPQVSNRHPNCSLQLPEVQDPSH